MGIVQLGVKVGLSRSAHIQCTQCTVYGLHLGVTVGRSGSSHTHLGVTVGLSRSDHVQCTQCTVYVIHLGVTLGPTGSAHVHLGVGEQIVRLLRTD